MAYPNINPAYVWRDYNAQGIPASGIHEPEKYEIRRLFSDIQDTILALIAGGGGDIEVARGVIYYDVVGGTENAIEAEPDATLPDDRSTAVYILYGISQPNTGDVTINGTPLLTNSGNQIAPGGLVAGGIYLFLSNPNGTQYRLVSDQASASIQAAAEAAQAAAEAAQEAAEQAASANLSNIESVTIAQTTEFPGFLEYLRTAGFDVVGKGAALYKRGDGNKPGGFFSADGAGWELTENPVNPYMFGAVGDGDADDLDPLNKSFELSALDGVVVELPEGTFAAIAGSPLVPSNTQIRGTGGIIWQKTIPDTDPGSASDPGDGEFSALHIDKESENITINGAILRGPYWPADTIHRMIVASPGTGYSASFVATAPNGATATVTSSGGVINGATVTDSGSATNGERLDFDLSAGGGSGGRVYGVFQDTRYRSIGIAISGRYDTRFYEGHDGTWVPTEGPSKNIFIQNCDIEGFGQSGVLADQIDGFRFEHNTVYRCGRDGLRMYGVVDFNVSDNLIDQMAPGFINEGVAPNNNVYGVTATRVHTAPLGDGSLLQYRTTKDGVVSRNVVRNCWSWKNLDTHGGRNVEFVDNICRDSYHGIGIDEGGGSLTQGYAPPIDIKAINNLCELTDYFPLDGGVGLFCTAESDLDIDLGYGMVLMGNTVINYGRDAQQGAIYVGNHRDGMVVGNVIRNSLRSALIFQQRVQNFIVSNIAVEDVRQSSGGVCSGINIQTATASLVIGPCSFRQSLSETLTGISPAAPTGDYGAVVGAEHVILGNVTPFSNAQRFVGGGATRLTKAWANINNNGTSATISGGIGIASATRTGTGVVRVVLSGRAPTSINTQAINVTPKRTNTSGSRFTLGIAPVNATTFDVNIRDENGDLADFGFYLQVNAY